MVNMSEVEVKELNLDCLLKIFEYLSLLDRIRVARVNKTWYEASHLSLSTLKSWEIRYVNSTIVFVDLKTNIRIEVDCESRAFEECLIRIDKFVSELYVRNIKNDSQAMIILSTCRNLEKVHLYGMHIDKVRFLLWKLEKLNDLSFNDTDGFDEDGCLELVLSRLRLTSFYFYYENLEIGDGFFKSLPTDIKSLGIVECIFKNERSAFNMLGNFKHLKSLTLIYSVYQDANFELFIDLFKKLNLEKLNISENPEVVDDNFIIELAKHADGLTELDISRSAVTDEGLNAVTNLPNLEVLIINELYHIEGNIDVNLPNLKCLRCECSDLSGKALLKFLNTSDKIEYLAVDKFSKKFIKSAVKIMQARKNKIPLKIQVSASDKKILEIVNKIPKEHTRLLKFIITDEITKFKAWAFKI